jgi:diguanylate cyclase (GGDEF)-like protein
MAAKHPAPENGARPFWQTVVEGLFELKPQGAITLCTVLFVISAVTDYFTPPELNLTFLYVFVILIACWNLGAIWGWIFTALASGMQFVVLDQIKGEYFSAMYFYLDMANRLFTFLLVIALAVPLRTVHGREKVTARIDWLTRIPNRAAFVEALVMELARYERIGVPFSVACLDVDDSKAASARVGHDKGGRLQRTIADTVRGDLRKTDMIARLAGDKFAILFPASNMDTALPIVKRIHAGLEARMRQEGWPVTFGVGLGTFGRPGLSPEEVIALCDSLMHRVGSEGKKTFVYDQFVGAGAPFGKDSGKR